MAFESKLGEAYVELRARRQKFARDLKQAEQKALAQTRTLGARLGTQLGKLRASFAVLGPAAIAGAATALTIFLGKAIEAGDAIGKNSRLLGLSAEAFQELEFAASQAGVSQDEFIVGTRNLGKRIAEADAGLETYARSFRALGVELRDQDGQLRSVDDVLLDVADGFKQSSSDTEKLFHAMNLFGRGGARMINLLNRGSEGIQQMRSEARRLGLVLDNEMVVQAEEATDQIDKLRRAIGVNFNRALLTVLPLVTRFAAKLAEVGPRVARTIELFAPAELVGVEELNRRIEHAGSLLERLRTAAAAPLDTLPLDLLSIEKRIEVLKVLRDKAEAAEAALAATFEPPPEADKLAQVLDGLRFRLEQLGRTEFEREVAEQLKQTEGAGRAQIEILVRQIQAREAINERVAEYKRLLDEAKGPLERLHETTTQLLADVQAGLISQEDANRIIELLARQTEEQLRALQDLKGEGEDVWGSLGEAVESWGDQFASEMAEALVTGKLTFKALLRSFIADFVKQALAATVFNPLFKALGGALGGFGGPAGVTTTLAGGIGPVALQHGGRLAGGEPAVVGEAGPELFVPSGAGSVLPTDAVAGVTIHQQLLVQPGLGAEVREQLMAMRPLIEQWSQSAVADAVRRGGRLATNLRGGR